MTLQRSLLTALLATASSTLLFGQAATPAPPAAPAPSAAPAPKPASPLSPGPALTPLPPPAGQPAAPGIAAADGTLPFRNASFEEPVVTKRTLNTDGGNPAPVAESDWGHLTRRNGQGEGALHVGLTNEFARTGKQSFYVDFAGITGTRMSGALMTQQIPIRPDQVYKVGMWGRMDKDRPLTLDQRRPYMQMEFEFYEKDDETQAGSTDYRTIRIPGSVKRLLFTSSHWVEVYGVARAPKTATQMKVTFVFNVPNDPGKTDGLLFFDDLFVQELPRTFPIEASDEIIVEVGEADAAAPQATGVAPASTAAPAEQTPAKPAAQEQPK